MEVTIVGFDFYDYEKDGVRKRGGNLHYLSPLRSESGSGRRSGNVYVRYGTDLWKRCFAKDFSKSIPGNLHMEMQSNGKAIVTDVVF